MWPAHQGLKPLATNARPPGEERTLGALPAKTAQAEACGSGEKSAPGSRDPVDDGSAAQAEAQGKLPSSPREG
jgi:hypothetical protein